MEFGGRHSLKSFRPSASGLLAIASFIIHYLGWQDHKRLREAGSSRSVTRPLPRQRGVRRVSLTSPSGNVFYYLTLRGKSQDHSIALAHPIAG
jgi:hypothetical protein